MEEIEGDRKKETADYLKTAPEYFSEETKSLKLDFFNDASNANEGMVVKNIATLEEPFVDDEFASKS